MKKIKVLHYIPGFNEGGIEARLLDWYRNMDRSKIQFYIIKLNNKKSNKVLEIEKLGGKFYDVTPFAPHTFFKYIKQVSRIIKEINPDIIHVHSFSTGIFPLAIAKREGINTRIIHSRTTDYLPNEKSKLIKKLLKRYTPKFATDYFACSKNAGKWGFGEKHNIKIINNGITLSLFEFDATVRNEYRKKLGIKKDEIVIGSIGRLSPQKNLPFLIDVFYEMTKKNLHYKLVLVGDGSMKEELEAKIEALNLTNQVIFTGTQHNVWNYYMAFDIFLCTSFYEGFGTTAIEAQATGVNTFVSTNFPEEVVLTDFIQRLPLNYGAKKWAKIIAKTSLRKRSTKDIEYIKKAGFDAKDVAQNLEKFYLEKGAKL